MAYKILTKNGIDNSNIDGARGEYFNSGMRDGIVQGVLNEGLFTATASNIISLDTCELRIAGHRIVIDEPVYHTFTNAPSNDTRYSFVAQIIVNDNQDVNFSLFVQTASTSLIKNDLYKNITGVGTYQVEIGRFTLTTGLVIEDVVRTIDVITGGTGKGKGIIELIGTLSLPINFATSMEVGQLYSCSGEFYTTNSLGITILFDTAIGDTKIPYLIYKYSTNKILILNGGLFNSDIAPDYIVISNNPNGAVILNFNNTTGDITSYNANVSLNSLNGSIKTDTTVNRNIYAPTTSGTSGQILQSNGVNTAPTWIDMPSTAPTLEEQTIESTAWTSLSGQTPYTYSATITLTATLDTNSIVELINNQPALFATYGFAIGNISGQVATIYSIGQPSDNVTLTVGVTG